MTGKWESGTSFSTFFVNLKFRKKKGKLFSLGDISFSELGNPLTLSYPVSEQI